MYNKNLYSFHPDFFAGTALTNFSESLQPMPAVPPTKIAFSF